MNTQTALWLGFNLFVVAMLAHRPGRLPPQGARGLAQGGRASGRACGSPSACSSAGGLFYFGYWNREQALQWVTAYVVEYSLSVDNLFVFLMVFAYFRVTPEVQHRVLFWGIVGAFIMRAVLIITGTALVQRFHWLLYIFGAFLVFTAVKMAFSKDDDAADPEQTLIVRVARRMLPVARQGEGSQLLHAGGWPAQGDAALPGAAGGGGHGPALRPGLHPRRAGHQPGRLHRLHVQRVRHPRPALALLRGGEPDGQVPPAQDGPGRHPRLRGHEDARHLLRHPRPHRRVAGRHRRRAAGLHHRLAHLAQGGRGARGAHGRHQPAPFRRDQEFRH